MTPSRLERCTGAVRPALAAFGRLGIAASLIVLGATSLLSHAFATTPSVRHNTPTGAGGTLAVVNSLANTVTAYGAAASGDDSPTATLTLGLDNPDCATFDAAGNLWVVNYNGRSVVEYASDAFSGGPQAPERTISSDSSGSLNSPAGYAFDQSGDLWVANDLTNTVVEYATDGLASGVRVPRATISSDGSHSLSGPVALTLDQPGDLWVANYDNSTVVEYKMSDLASGPQVPAITISADASGTLNSPLGLAFDRSGDLWVAANLSNKLLEYTKSRLASGPEAPAVTISADSSGSLNSPGGIAFDTFGDLWVANYGDDSLAEFAPAQLALSGTLATSAVAGPSTGLSTPQYVAIDPAAGTPTASQVPTVWASRAELVMRAGLARVQVTCERAPCSGSIDLVRPTLSTSHLGRGHRKSRDTLLGSVNYSLAWGGSGMFEVHLSRAARRLVAYSKSDRPNLEIVVTVRRGKSVSQQLAAI